MKILDRYIAKELLAPFGFGVAMFTAIFLGAAVLPHLAKLAINGGRTSEVFWIFMLSLPGTVVLTVPMAVLLATLLGMGRLSSDLEIVASLASGVSLRRLATPVMGMAILVAILDFFFMDTVVPQCAVAANRIKEQVLARTDVVIDRRLTIVVPDPTQGPPRLLALARKLRLDKAEGASQSPAGTLLDVTVVYLSEDGKPEVVAQAERALFDRKVGQWRMHDVQFYYLPKPVGKPAAGGRQDLQALTPVRVTENLVDLGKPEDVGRDSRDLQEIPMRELRRTIRNLAATGMPTDQYEVELHQRIAVPFAALVFALVGVPLGLRPQRSGSSLGLGLSVLIIFVYYILWNYLRALGRGGAMDPFLAAWVPNAVCAFVGLFFLKRAPK